MWVLRALNGPYSGKMFPLKEGRNIIGRGAHSDIVIQSSGISKEHAQIDLLAGKLIVTDLQSRNGTMVNGVKIRSQRMQMGDKIALYDLLFDIVPSQPAAQAPMYNTPSNMSWGPGSNPPAYGQGGMSNEFPRADLAIPPTTAGAKGQHEAPRLQSQSISGYIQHYVENVAMPGVYRLTELSDFRTVIVLMVTILILATSALSTVIMVQVSRDSIVSEAKRRTTTLATMLQDQNRAAIAAGQENALDTSRVANEEGVSEALIVAQDGQILAPPRKAGGYSKNPFVAQATRTDRPYTERTSSSEVGSSAPIYFYDQQLGKQTIRAYAVVIYELSALAVDDSQFVILFIKTLLLASLIGGIIAYFLVRIVEHPIEALNRQLDKALREGDGQTETAVQIPALQILVNNINSALARSGDSGSAVSGGHVYVDRDSESQNLIQLIGLPAMILDGPDEQIKFMNREFEQVTGLSFANLQRQSLDAITDQALKLSLQDLVARSRQQPSLIAVESLDFSGENYELCIQAVQSDQGIAYFLIILQPEMGDAMNQAGGF